MKSSSNVATLIERYFTDRLMRQRNVSTNTISSYRDTFRLLFTFAQARLRVPYRSRDQAWCQRQDPQSAAYCHSLLLPFRIL